MHRMTLSRPDDYEGWRDGARAAALAGVAADAIVWQVEGEGVDLFGGAGDPLPPPRLAPFAVSKRFLDLAETVVLHRDPERFALLYAMLLRLRDEPAAIADEADPLRRRLEQLAKEVRRDIHKMRAFVRFREIDGAYVAWFEPDHHIVRANAGFFARRFATMRWSILTPELSIHWDGGSLREGPGATRADAPAGDPVEALWKGYYASIFNPARLKVGTMLKEMPRKYWANMPETALIPELVAGAQARETRMVERIVPRAQATGNAGKAWEALREEAAHCTRCDLYRCATRTVFGEGPVDADLMIVGEQPGDQEDLAGKPFVGPAGRMLDEALEAAGVDRARTYVTNAVKHFKFEPRGKRRIHAKPNAGEIKACRWWIDQERAIVAPRRIVMLGTTAIHSLLGKATTLSSVRGRALELPDGGLARATIHPSFLLRMPDKARAEEEYAMFVRDLKAAAE
ncbi:MULTISPECIES: UdgX family uracil-DNA binding protein [unclassified Sphingomonas]|uniref:UdgX family uracil-DNA binding protein n=1 Tax=unclassified Sphingomonas TaxID=196159 RepID=UPI00070028E1|nr:MULTISPECIES: UdgX family uracil-DNA binding protein [unclassified Sphingomonas]KQX25727.1 DNA polymerase [Sphingomonas sp. Root1294]KQY66716.1 DNA polymerase [Sphingomonas sp. Root50]KRB90139.1 DNA polymerase [Sphingomonas sp. Root720]